MGMGKNIKYINLKDVALYVKIIPFGIYEREERKRKIIGRQTGLYSGG